MFLFVLRLGLDVLVSWLRVLCACVHVLCRFACVSRVEIFWLLLLLLARVCLLRARAHALVSTRALARTLTLAHAIACYTWFEYLPSPSLS